MYTFPIEPPFAWKSAKASPPIGTLTVTPSFLCSDKLFSLKDAVKKNDLKFASTSS